MPTILAKDIIGDANTILNDVLHTRWPNDELLRYLNMAQLEIANKRPDSSVTNTDHSCTASTKQTLPSTALRLIKVISNTSSGRAITMIDQEVLDEQIPDWHDDSTPATRVDHYVYDDRDPKTFYLFPVPVNNHDIDVVFSVAPANVDESDFESGTEKISIDDIYHGAILDYMLYRCFGKDTENAANAARASAHLQSFLQSLGDKTQADAAASPNNG